MDEFFANPFWHALNSEQSSIALGTGLARRYPADVIPFAGLEDASPEALSALHDLLAPGESIYVTGAQPLTIPGITHDRTLPGLQMHFTAKIPTAEPSAIPSAIQVQQLTAPDASAMIALTDLAFPGFYRPRTYTLGHYVGIHVKGELVAMAGERVALPGFRELSAVCTHPEHTERGFAALLIRHLLRAHAGAGLRSFLHVTATNHRAVALYERLGFERTRPLLFHQLSRTHPHSG
jgi:predicted GNAT family acetyltransferase